MAFKVVNNTVITNGEDGQLENLYIDGTLVLDGDGAGNVSLRNVIIDTATVDLSGITTDDITEGSTNLYYTDARVDANFSAKTTSDLTEGTNLYYTDARVQAVSINALSEDASPLLSANLNANNYVINNLSNPILSSDAATKSYVDTAVSTGTGSLTTDDIPEGAVNEYYLDSRARAAISVTGSGTYDSLTGVIDIQGGVTSVNTLTGDVVLSTSEISEGSNLYYTSLRANSDFDARLSTKSTTDLTEGSNLYYTDLRANSAFDARLLTKSTTDLAEGSNLYYTDARFNTAFNNKSTTDLAEGTNLYYTDTRSRAAISATGDIDYNSTTGVISFTQAAFPVTSVNALVGAVVLSTSEISEGTNLYYTDARANTAFDARLLTKSTDNLTEGSNLYYTDARFDSRLSLKSTTDLTEGSNLYYTDARFDSRLSLKSTDNLTEGSNLYYTDARFDNRLSLKSTTDLTEGTNLYFTTTRANNAIDARVTKTFVDALNIQASSVDPDSVALGTDTTGNYVATITGTSGEIVVTGSGSESATVVLSLPTNMTVPQDLTVTGNLTVNGTTITNDTSTVAVNDPYITVGGMTPLQSDDNKDRGVRFRWHDGGVDTVAGSFVVGHTYIITSTGTTDFTLIGADDSNPGTVFVATGAGTGTGTANDELNTQLGFFGFDDNDQSFFYIPDATESGETFSGTLGNAKFTTVTANLVGNVTGNTSGTHTGPVVGNASSATILQTARTFSLSGDVITSAPVAFNGSGDVVLNTVIQPNSVGLGTDTFGNYVAEIVAGSGISVFGSGVETSVVTVAHANTSAQASVNNSNGTVIQDVTLDEFGHITALESVNLDNRYYTETESDSRFINTSGDAMTGLLTLSSDPINLLHAATKQYVDTSVTNGVVASADKWTVARALILNGDVTGNTVIDGSANVTLTVTVADDSHNHVISNVDGLQLALDAKLDATANAVSASKWATARTITLDGDVSGNVSIDGTANATLTVTVADDSHNHVISNVDGLQLALDGKLDSTANAVSASKWAIARAFILTGDVTGNTVIDGSGNVSLTTSVADDSHNHVISNVDGLQLALDGKLDSTANAVSASKLAIPRTIALIGDVTGWVNFDGSANATITAVVVDDSHTHDGRYYTEAEADSRFVNASGDTMTGPLTLGSIVGNAGGSSDTVNFTGTITATGDVIAYISDSRLKDFHGKIENALEKVSKLNGYYYTENSIAKELGYNNNSLQVGVSAQEVEAVLPEIVKSAPVNALIEESSDYKTVAYDKMVPLLIEAIKELKDQNKEMAAEIAELKSKLNS